MVYHRVSSREQAEGYSIDAQREKCEELITRLGLELAHEPFVEVHSAKKRGDRPVFSKMVEFLEQNPHVGGIVAHKIDRLMRNLGDLSTLFEVLDLRPWLVDQDFPNNAQGRLATNMLAVFAKYYSDNLREEVRKGQAQKARQGGTPFGAPHGYVQDRGKVPTLDPDRRQELLRIFEEAAHGYSLDALRERAFERGYRYSRKTARIPRSTLHQILVNPYYQGEVHFRGNVFQGNHEPLVSRELFRRVQQALTRSPAGYGPHSIPYRGLLRCSCGRAVTAEVKTKKTKQGERRYYYYRCARYRKCGGRRLTLAQVDEALGAIVQTVQLPPEHLEWVRDALKYAKAGEQQYREQAIQELDSRLKRVRDRLVQAYMDQVDGNIDRGTYDRVRAQLQEEESQAQLALEGHSSASGSTTDLGLRVLELANRAYELWLAQEHQEREKLVQVLCLNLTLDGVTLTPEMRKPFDLLAEGLSHSDKSG